MNQQNLDKRDYKNTLNLPETAFPMKASLAEKEPLRLEAWATRNVFESLRNARKNQEKYVLLDGPPYANGEIHIGHALNKILKDIVVKSKSLDGKDAAFVPTWDCHGLPIEHNVEKKHGKVGQKLDADAFRAECRSYVPSQVALQRAAFQRLGIIADWDHPSLTMDFSYEANIIRLLGKIIQNGHVIRGYKPVHWCLDCASSLAEAEVEYADKTSLAVDVKFKVEDSAALAKIFQTTPLNKPIFAVIWTTTPWTLPANQGLCLGKAIDYALVKFTKELGEEFLIIAEALVEKVAGRAKALKTEILGRCKGAALEQQRFSHPFQARIVPMVLGSHVTTEEGTGIVHTAPAHGVEDFEVGQAYGLKLENPVGANGCYTAETPDLAGLFVRKAEDAILDLLKTHQTLLSAHPLEHSYPHCWRHKTPLIFRATSQWFISLSQNGLREKTMKAIDTVEWIPSSGKARISSMIRDRPDWCISRQRTWGTPMPLFLHKTTEALHPDTLTMLEKVAKAVEKGGIEVWFKDPQQFCTDENYFPIPDTLDVWFDSGASSFCLLQHHPLLAFPADLYLEGSDQHRGWFQSSLLLSVASREVAPYRAVLTHGFTVDEKGYKMSKSLGNVIAPQEIIKEFGADILRLWAASTDYRLDMVVSRDVFKQLTDTYRRLRNTLRFLLANLNDFYPDEHRIEIDRMLGLDQWICERAKHLQGEICEEYRQHNFHQVVQKVHYFCSIELGSFYLDVIKDRQYTLKKDSLARRSAQTAMFHMAQAIIRWLAPILSFTMDEASDYLPASKTKTSAEFFAAEWWIFPELKNRKLSTNQMETLIQIREQVNKEIEAARASGELGSALEAEVKLILDPETEKALYPFLEAGELRFAFIVSKVEVFSGLNNQVEILVSQGEKCERCWHRVSSVGESASHPSLCLRCIENIEAGSGETRVLL